jgi:hypothetical protein
LYNIHKEDTMDIPREITWILMLYSKEQAEDAYW